MEDLFVYNIVVSKGVRMVNDNEMYHRFMAFPVSCSRRLRTSLPVALDIGHRSVLQSS